MELIGAIAIFGLGFAGLGLGLLLAGRPPKTSCGGLSCVGGGSCDGCPRRRAEAADDD